MINNASKVSLKEVLTSLVDVHKLDPTVIFREDLVPGIAHLMECHHNVEATIEGRYDITRCTDTTCISTRYCTLGTW